MSNIFKSIFQHFFNICGKLNALERLKSNFNTCMSKIQLFFSGRYKQYVDYTGFVLILFPIIKLFKIKILILIFLALSCTQLVADEYSDGLKRATKENKPALLYFYSRY